MGIKEIIDRQRILRERKKSKKEVSRMVKRMEMLAPIEILRVTQRDHLGIDYQVEHVHRQGEGDYYESRLTGIKIPDTSNVNLVRDLFYPLLRSLGIGSEEPEPCAMKQVDNCTVALFHHLNNFTEADNIARQVIEGYVKYKSGIERAIRYAREKDNEAIPMEQIHTRIRPEARRKFMNQFGLDFLVKRAA
ncbi:MAG: hypothetical protein AABW93_02050 [Nanoarchaeota archaeon]